MKHELLTKKISPTIDILQFLYSIIYMNRADVGIKNYKMPTTPKFFTLGLKQQKKDIAYQQEKYYVVFLNPLRIG